MDKEVPRAEATAASSFLPLVNELSGLNFNGAIKKGLGLTATPLSYHFHYYECKTYITTHCYTAEEIHGSRTMRENKPDQPLLCTF